MGEGCEKDKHRTQYRVIFHCVADVHGQNMNMYYLFVTTVTDIQSLFVSDILFVYSSTSRSDHSLFRGKFILFASRL